MESIHDIHRLLLRQPYYGELTSAENDYQVEDGFEEMEADWPWEISDYYDDREFWLDYLRNNNPDQRRFDFRRQELFVTGPDVRTPAFYPNLRKVAAALQNKEVRLRQTDSEVGSVKEMIRDKVLKGITIMDMVAEDGLKGAEGCLRAMGARVDKIEIYDKKYAGLNDLDIEISAITVDLIKAIRKTSYDLIFWEEGKFYLRFATEDEYSDEKPARRLRNLETVLRSGGDLVDTLPWMGYANTLRIYDPVAQVRYLQRQPIALKSA